MPIESQEDLDAVIGLRFHARRCSSTISAVISGRSDRTRRAPLGPHSDELQRVLNYLGLFPIDGKLITEQDGSQWFVCRLAGFPALRANRVAGPFETESRALHEVFRLRLLDVFGLSFSGPAQ